jgi:predicted metalloprotease with PDZ domain
VLRRAGLVPAKRYLEKLAEEWGRMLEIPGRRRQSVEEASFDAWIKHYKPDESTVNSTVSYYLKGGVVALCLDLEIRRRTGGARSLDDVMRRLWQEYGARDVGYADEDVQREMERAVDLDLGDFFDRCVRGREDPDLGGALAGAGLALRPKKEEEAPGGWLGITTRSTEGRIIAAQVLAGGPAEAGGIAPGDELVALGGFRVDDKSLGERLAARRAGDEVSVALFSRDELREVTVVLGEKPPAWEIVPDDAAGEPEKALRQAWLGD